MSSRQQIAFDPKWKPGLGSRLKNLVLGKNRNRLHARAPPPNNNTTRRYRNPKDKGRVRGTRRIRPPLVERIKTINAESWKALSKLLQEDYYLSERTGKYKMYQNVIDEMEYGPYINANNAAPNIHMPPVREQAAHNQPPPTLSVHAYDELGYGSNPRYNLQELYEPVRSQDYASGFGGATSSVILSYKLKGPNTSQRRKTEPPPTLSVHAYDELGYGSNPNYKLQSLYEPVRSQEIPSGYGATSSVILSYKLKGPNTSQRRNTKLPPRLTVDAYEELGYGSNPRYNLQRLYRPIRTKDYASGFGGATSSVIVGYELKGP